MAEEIASLNNVAKSAAGCFKVLQMFKRSKAKTPQPFNYYRKDINDHNLLLFYEEKCKRRPNNCN